MAKDCAICGKTMGIMTGKVKLNTGEKLCIKCLKAAGYSSWSSDDSREVQQLTVDQIKHKIDLRANGKASRQDFTPTQKFGSYAYFDDNSQTMLVNSDTGSFKPKTLISYDSVIDFEAFEDNEQILKSGLGTAIGGGMLFGPTGAIVGAIVGNGKRGKSVTNNLYIKLKLVDGNYETIQFISSKTKHSSSVYKSLKNSFVGLAEKLESIVVANSSGADEIIPFSPADELKKYSELLQSGILTQEEFDQKKAELLSL